MNCTIAFNSFPNNSSSVFENYSKDRFKHIEKPQYTTVKIKDLIHNLSLKSKNAVFKIHSFSKLEKNWDSYGADTPSNISINNAIEFIHSADKDGLVVYFAAPGRNGDVLVEYSLPNRISAEVYFNSDGSNELLIFGDNECFTEGTIENNYTELLNYKNEFEN